MPVRRLLPTRPPAYAQLVDRLADEWRAPDPTAAEPVILEEADRNGRVVHVYVVWTDWAHMERVARGDIIMDAAERVKSQEDVLAITIAMGLTPDEADGFQLIWR